VKIERVLIVNWFVGKASVSYVFFCRAWHRC